jgi:hypothetical protein
MPGGEWHLEGGFVRTAVCTKCRTTGPAKLAKAAAATQTDHAKRAPGFRLEPGYRVRDEYGERGELTVVVEYWFASVQ